jgi:ATP-dependent DNA helicase RecQ
LLEYFGERLAEPCGNCDNCLQPPQTWDATVVAQKALSCVYRTGQRFGVGYIADVLTGKDDERIRRNGHHRLSTFGIGAELSGTAWRGVFRALIAKGHLEVDLEGHGALRLSGACRALLRGETRLELRRAPPPAETKQRSGARTQALRSFDLPLFEALRALRRELAEEQGVPPYVIFHDVTLQEMARRRPATLAGLGDISGVGERKLSHYGRRFLDEIGVHPLAQALHNGLGDTVNETLYLYLQGQDVEAIAARRELKSATVYGHLAAASEVVPLDEAQYTEVVNTLDLLDARAEGALKPAYEALGQAYDYGLLKCVLAGMQ